MFRNLDIDFRVFSLTDIEIDSKNKLSAGSYGETFVGTMKDKFGNSVACVVKRYKEYDPTEVLDEDIIKEIIFLRLLNQFNVRGVVKLFGILLHENKFYLVLEKLDETLQDLRLKDKTHVDPPQVKHIFHDLLDAINSMHELGILHNDLKLANIMLKGQDVKLIDFGLSKFIGIAPPYKQVINSYRTTPVIMAPDEQRISYATDVFSIGRTMFHFYLKQYNLINTNSAGTSLCDEKRRCYTKTQVDAYFGSNGYELLTHMLDKNVEKRYCAITALNHSYFKPSNGGGFKMTLLSHGVTGRIDNIKEKNLEYCYYEKIYENYKNDPLTLKTIENDAAAYKEMINELLRLYHNDYFDSFDALVNGIILTNQHFETYISEKYNKCGDFLLFNAILYQVITSNYSNKMDKSYLMPNFNVNLIEILKFDINFYPVSSQIMFIYLNLITNTSTTDEESKMLRASHDFIETSLFNILFWFIQSNILSHVKINDIVIFSAIKVLKNMKIDWTKYSFLTMDDLIYQRMNNYMIDTISQIDVSNYDQYALIYAYEHLKFPIDELKSKVSLKKLVELKYSVQLLIDNGFTITDLFSSGIELKQIPKNILLTTKFDELKKYKNMDFWKVDISPLELYRMGASLNDLIEAGYDNIVYFESMIDKSLDDSDPEKPLKLKDVKPLASIFSLKQLASIFSLPKLVQYYDLEQLHDLFKPSDLILSHLFDIKDLKKYFQLNYFVKYFNPKELYDSGFDLKEIYVYFSPSTLLLYFSLQDLRNKADVGPLIDLPISKLKEAFSLKELVDAKKPLSKLIENYKISELKQYFELQEFLNNGVKIADLKDEYKLKDFVDQKIQPNALLSAGFNVGDLKDFFKPIRLLDAGVSLSILKDAYPLSDLRNDGISATSLQLAGVAYDELKKLFRLDELVKENVPLKELLYDYKFTISELKIAGIQLNQFQSLGVPLIDLKGVFDLPQLLEIFQLRDFKDVFTIPELKNAGIKPDALLSATFELEKIYQFYTLAELIDAKIALSKIKFLGVNASELKNLGKGISANDLVDAGYTLDDLTAANFSARELFLANIKLSNIFKTDAFKYSDIKESYRLKPDPELEMLLKQCTKNLLRKTNPDCRFDPKSNKVINTPITSKKGGRRGQTKKSRRAKQG